MIAMVLTRTHVVRLLLVVAASFVGSSSAAEGLGCCPKFWTGYGTNCYRLYGKESVWNEAEEHCNAESPYGRGAHLLSIAFQGEQDFVYRYLDEFVLKSETPSGKGTWIGIQGRGQDGAFAWTDPRIISDYSNWAKKHSQSDLCAAINFDHDGQWVETDCNEKQSYVICKFSLEN